MEEEKKKKERDMPARIFSAMSSLHAFLCAELMTEEADRCRQPKDTKQPVGEVEGSYEPQACPNRLIGMDNLTSYFAPMHLLASSECQAPQAPV